MNMPPKNMISVTRNTHMPERGRLELLLHAVEVVLQLRVMRVLACAVPRRGRVADVRLTAPSDVEASANVHLPAGR